MAVKVAVTNNLVAVKGHQVAVVWVEVAVKACRDLATLLSSELFEFLKYLYLFKSYAKFLVFRFINSACLFEILFLLKFQCL